MKILIAEDNPIWRQMLKQNVSMWGYEPVLAEDGKQAWNILQLADAPRLAILDWQMPQMDGIDVCRRLKQSHSLPFTYIVMLTSRDAEEDIVEGLDAGADEYLTKPVEPTVLRSRLKAAQRIVEAVPPKEWSLPRVPGYEVQRLLGKGAFATVWEAIQSQTDRRVALKIIRVDLATEEVFNRFAREIQIAKRLEHPHIARIYDGQIDRHIGYYAMELVDGLTLDKYVKLYQAKVAKILCLAVEVCDALNHAHEQGVVHRDLKPSNIMVTHDGSSKLVDFGLARSMFRPEAESETFMSLDGSVIGTPLFMAPEQARGENEKLDGRVDIYALGVILYMMLVRRHPLQVDFNDRWKTLRTVAEGHVCPPTEVKPKFDREVERILLKALANEPSARYLTAAELGADILRFLRTKAAEAEDKIQRST
jgi:serine/threonine protein kinase